VNNKINIRKLAKDHKGYGSAARCVIAGYSYNKIIVFIGSTPLIVGSAAITHPKETII
jgi:hypothetical protein